MASIQQAEWVLNGTGGGGFRTILCKWSGAQVGVNLGVWLVQRADRLLNNIRRAIFDSQVSVLFGVSPRKELIGESSRKTDDVVWPPSGRVIGDGSCEGIQRVVEDRSVAQERFRQWADRAGHSQVRSTRWRK